MKKSLLWALVLVMSISLVVFFNLSGCGIVEEVIGKLEEEALDESEISTEEETEDEEEVEEQLKNSADALDKVPPDDSFDGTVLDMSKWIDNSCDGVVKQDGRLIVSTDSTPEYSSAEVQSVWEFTGDFNVQVDFQIGEGWSCPAKNHLDGAVLGVIIEGESYHITRIYRENNNSNVLCAWSSSDLIYNEISSNVLSGKYQLVRVGTTLTLLYDTGSGWQELTSGTVPSSPAKVYMGNGSINACHAFTTYFDNFHVNSGITTYQP